ANWFNSSEAASVEFRIEEKSGNITLSNDGGKGKWSDIEIDYQITNNQANCTLP
ncbi:MAG: hypothetical protein GX055_10345, partial [Desulfovibrionales bacterium]|nr:hypothetical protein [Desulfovibrionales bacterium]